MASDVVTPASIIDLDKIYFEHFDAVAQIADRLADIGSRVMHATSDRYSRIGSEVGIDDFLNKDVPEYEKRVVSIAIRALSSPLAPFEAEPGIVLQKAFEAVRETYRSSHDLPRDKLHKRAREACAACSPLKVWQALKARHDPEAQNKAAATAHANVLGRQLAPHLYSRGYGWRQKLEPVEMKIVKGRVEVCISVYTEEKWSGGGRRMNNASTMREFGQGTAFALAQLHPEGDHVCGNRLVGLCDAYQMDRKPLVSRERISLGDGVDVVAGFQQFKLYLPQEIAASLNMFIAEYGQPPSD